MSSASTELFPGGGTPTPTREPHPGQAPDVPVHLSLALVRLGRDLAGAAPEPTPEMEAHVQAFAQAQGDACRALPWNDARFRSDARSVELLEARRAEAREARAEVIAHDERVGSVVSALGAAPVGSALVVAPAALLCGGVGLVGAFVLFPTVDLLCGGGKTFPPDLQAPLTIALASMLGQLPPFVAMIFALCRAGRRELVSVASVELACFAALAWARWRLLNSGPGIGLTAGELAAVADASLSRSMMPLAIEALCIACVTGVGMAVSRVLARVDERSRLEGHLARERERLAAAMAREQAIEAWCASERERELARDIAIARGDNERALVYALMWQGVLEQTQANWDALHGAERAPVSVDARAAG